ncbi:MAG: hypothetical protein Q9202_005953 [Teloschistes flavicans]
MTSWRHTRPEVIDQVGELLNRYPDHRLTVVGHSLGGAVAALASLDFHAKGWGPQITTFGEPKIGNEALMKYLDQAFLDPSQSRENQTYRRVTHVDDPVPLLPLSEWGYRSHSGEIFISKPDLPPEREDLHLCEGNKDPLCLAGTSASSDSFLSRLKTEADIESFKEWWLHNKGFPEGYAFLVEILGTGIEIPGSADTEFSLQRLIRFLAKDGKTYYGDAILPPGETNIAKATQGRVITGDIFGKHDITGQIADVRLLLAPLARDDVKTVRCLGLNYEQHAKESNMSIPEYPVLFYKPTTALTGPFENIPVPALAQEVDGLDYECELVAVIGKEARDVPESQALDYVLGYSVGNDVSHREWQIKRGGGQWALGKMYDGWAPFGPGIVSSRIIKDPQSLRISTRLNGTTVQDSSTRDMIFGVAKTISFLSQGTTLLPGDIIFTGTSVSLPLMLVKPLVEYTWLIYILDLKAWAQEEARHCG